MNICPNSPSFKGGIFINPSVLSKKDTGKINPKPEDSTRMQIYCLAVEATKSPDQVSYTDGKGRLSMYFRNDQLRIEDIIKGYLRDEGIKFEEYADITKEDYERETE